MLITRSVRLKKPLVRKLAQRVWNEQVFRKKTCQLISATDCGCSVVAALPTPKMPTAPSALLITWHDFVLSATGELARSTRELRAKAWQVLREQPDLRPRCRANFQSSQLNQLTCVVNIDVYYTIRPFKTTPDKNVG